VPAREQASPDGDAGGDQHVTGGAAQLGAGQVEVAGDPPGRQPQLTGAAQPPRVTGAADHDAVGDQRLPTPALQAAGREPQRPADPGVGEVDGTVRGEPVVEEQVGGHAHR